MKINIAINTNIRAFNHTPNDNPMTDKNDGAGYLQIKSLYINFHISNI